jgi:DNA-directed RNA polymerase beta subunit
MADNRDVWDKAESAAKIVGAVFLPIVLLLLGNTYAQHQKELEAQRMSFEASANRLTTLIKNLSSDNARERKVAIIIAGYMAKTQQFPPELVPVLQDVALMDPSQDVSRAAVNSLTIGASAKGELAPAIAETLKELPPRIYIQIKSEGQREQAKRLTAMLTDGGYLVPGIERVDQVPKAPEVRYFHPEQASEAERIVEALSKAGVKGATAKLVRGFETKVNAKQFEVWLPEGAG